MTRYFIFTWAVFSTLSCSHYITDPEPAHPNPEVLSLTELFKRDLEQASNFEPVQSSQTSVLIQNAPGGEIRATHDGGATWATLGHVTKAIDGGVWLPTVDGGVYAFNYLRGASSVFASAVNAVHLRFSDPPGYTLPADPQAPLVTPHAISILPKESDSNDTGSSTGSRAAITDIAGGTGFFGPEWSPQIGSRVFVSGAGQFAPIAYDGKVVPLKSILVVTDQSEKEIEYLEFENQAEGKVIMKRTGEEPVHVAKVKKPIQGIGRFTGSELIRVPGRIRANHAGVICVGTTDVDMDHLPPNANLNEFRGGFQIVPSIHWQDSSMNSGGDHAFVYLVVGPIQDPPSMVRYDMGVEGTYPLFYDGLRAGTGMTYFRFGTDSQWVPLAEALRLGKFKDNSGAPLEHLRGYFKNALGDVSAIRLVFE